MGPLVGRVLLDLGAEVLHVEPPGGDPTRTMGGFGRGFFTFYNHGKACEEVDLKAAAGQQRIHEVLATADVLVENYAPGVMQRLQLGHEALASRYPGLVYCSLKGFLDGPYAERIAVDEVVQMMSGLAYMTGLPGRPMRAGTSALDITGGLFAVIGILAALYERRLTGRGRLVRASLFESGAFLMGQFMGGLSAKHVSIPPMPAREQIWAVYQLFDTADGRQIFLAIVSDKHWRALCRAFAWSDLALDERWATGAGRLADQAELVSLLQQRLHAFPLADIVAACERENVPFGEVNTPSDLASNEHLLAGNHLTEVQGQGQDGSTVQVPRLPIRFA